MSASSDNTLRVWSLASGGCERVLEGHTREVTHVALSADGTRAVSASGDNTLRVWSLASGGCERVLEGHTRAVWHVALTADGTRAVSVSDDETLRVWDLTTGACLARLTVDYPVTCCAVSTDGRTIVGGDWFRRVHILRIRNLH